MQRSAHPDLALFRAYPRLRGRLPRRPFLSGPTPVEAHSLPGVGALFVKRDDRSCPLYGGNKPRKLEFAIGAALARGSHRLVTTGGLGTNHGLATTILGRDAGLATTLVLVHQPVTRAVEHTLLLHAAFGAEIVYGGTTAGAVALTLAALARKAVRGERPYLVPTGGTSATGNAGFVSAALELAEQVRAGELPEPAELWVPVGTGGTLTGLVVGLRLAGLATRVVGVLVTDILPPSPRALARAARRTLAALRRRDPSVPLFEPTPDDFDLATDHVGPGYGTATEESVRAVEVAATCGLSLETTYTGKCLAALRARVRAGSRAAGPILFWNTYNGVDVDKAAPRPLDRAALPARVRAVLERELGPRSRAEPVSPRARPEVRVRVAGPGLPHPPTFGLMGGA